MRKDEKGESKGTSEDGKEKRMKSEGLQLYYAS